MNPRDAFDVAYMPVELLGDGIANVTDNGVTLLVQPHYCAHCRDIRDGAGPCIHKHALFEAMYPDDGQDQYETYRSALGVGVQ